MPLRLTFTELHKDSYAERLEKGILSPTFFFHQSGRISVYYDWLNIPVMEWLKGTSRQTLNGPTLNRH